MDSFEIEAVDLLTVTKVIAGHDGVEEGQGWFIEKVVVRTESGANWTFNCNRLVFQHYLSQFLCAYIECAQLITM